MTKQQAALSVTIALPLALVIGGFGFGRAGLIGAIVLIAIAITYVLVAEALGRAAEALDAYEMNNRERRKFGLEGDWGGGDSDWDVD